MGPLAARVPLVAAEAASLPIQSVQRIAGVAGHDALPELDPAPVRIARHFVVIRDVGIGEEHRDLRFILAVEHAQTPRVRIAVAIETTEKFDAARTPLRDELLRVRPPRGHADVADAEMEVALVAPMNGQIAV